MFNPFGNGTEVPGYNWQSEPDTRGTWSVISSCMITLILCLWTALHLNIPTTEGDTHQVWPKIRWLIMGLLAPEMVVFVALNQRRVAYRLTKEMRSTFKESPERPFWSGWSIHGRRKPSPENAEMELCHDDKASPPLRRHPWTQVHSHYALMGGFAFDARDAKPNFMPDGRCKLAIQPHALAYLAEHSPTIIPDISKEDIRDKSKADGLAKFLVCIQAIWFCTQTIFRLAQQQTVSFLELNTFCHAICALLVYILWWNKPLDITVPTFLAGEEAWEHCALMCVTSTCDSICNPILTFLAYKATPFTSSDVEPYETELSCGHKYGSRTFSSWWDVFNGQYNAKLDRHYFEPRAIFRWDPDPAYDDRQASNASSNSGIQHDDGASDRHASLGKSMSIKKGQSLFGFRCMDVYNGVQWFQAECYIPPDNRGGHLGYPQEVRFGRKIKARYLEKHGGFSTRGMEATLEPSDVRRWQLCSQAWRKHGPPPKPVTIDLARMTDPRQEGVCDGRHNLSDLNIAMARLIDNRDDTYFFIAFSYITFTVAGSVYGGLHLLAWNAAFASLAEQVLWRFSGAIIAVSGPGVLAITGLTLIYARVALLPLPSNGFLSFLLMAVHFGAVTLYIVVMFALFFAYIGARAYLVVESCLQVARLPPGAYRNPEWSNIFPHVG